MVHLEIRFTAGRYHATPWGRHVNEGAVEWPPSPWRLLRALLAAGFNRLGWTEVPDEARALIEKLGAQPPTYYLPDASLGHTRHYLPQLKGSTSRVFDTFAYVGVETPLFVEFGVDLEAPEQQLLDALLPRIGYLGRAESWAELRRCDGVVKGLVVRECKPVGPSLAEPSKKEEQRERVSLLAPFSASEYLTWRAGALAAEEKRWREEARRKAEAKGKKAPAAPSKKEAAALEALFPATLVDALRADTRALQKEGWSQPPGSRWLSYLLRPDALASRRPGKRTAAEPPSADVAVLALVSDAKRGQALPLLKDAVLRADLLHKALVEKSDLKSDRRSSPCFTARQESGAPLQGHQHASLLPLGLKDGNRIDHVLVYCPMGFDAAARHALGAVRRTWAGKRPDIHVTLVGLGRRDKPGFEGIPHLGWSEGWRSYTPFVAPRYIKPRGRNTLEGQIREELKERGFPEPVSIEVELEGGRYLDVSEMTSPGAANTLPRLAVRWRHFRKERAAEQQKPPNQPALGLRIRFARKVQGPLMLGYGSHFGLGQFIPEAIDSSRSPSGSVRGNGPDAPSGA